MEISCRREAEKIVEKIHREKHFERYDRGKQDTESGSERGI